MAPMTSVVELLESVGPAVFSVLHRPEVPREPADVTLAEPDAEPVCGPDDLVLGVGVRAADAAAFLDRCAESRASAVVLRPGAAEAVASLDRSDATGAAPALAALSDRVTWSHAVWLLRDVVDRSDAPVTGDAGAHQDLFALADAAAEVVGAPVTIEDHRSRVLAYSSGQQAADTARVSTIVGRRVPPDVLAHYRAAGVFRRLARSSEPFLVPEGPDGTLPRYVVPVHAGGEWLGSIWVVATGPVPEAARAELGKAASVVAMHLLRVRAHAGLSRRRTAERIRRALTGGTPPGEDPGLPPPPWRVAALGVPAHVTDLEQYADFWAAALRRHGWRDPVLADVDGVVLAVVRAEGPGPGSWPWLAQVAGSARADGERLRVGGSTPVQAPAALARGRAEAVETLALRGSAPVADYGAAWAAITLARAVEPLRAAGPVGPAAAILEHDREHGTAYAATLRAWLAHPPRAAAARLHVHPNTLRHRMRRIAELVPLDLDDDAQRLALQLQLAAHADGTPRNP